MTVVTLQEAQANLEELAQKAQSGEEILIANGRGPSLRLVPETPEVRRFGIHNGMYKIPEDFDTMFAKEIEQMFYGDAEEE